MSYEITPYKLFKCPLTSSNSPKIVESFRAILEARTPCAPSAQGALQTQRKIYAFPFQNNLMQSSVKINLYKHREERNMLAQAVGFLGVFLGEVGLGEQSLVTTINLLTHSLSSHTNTTSVSHTLSFPSFPLSLPTATPECVRVGCSVWLIKICQQLDNLLQSLQGDCVFMNAMINQCLISTHCAYHFFPYTDIFNFHAGYTVTTIFSSQQQFPAAVAKTSSLCQSLHKSANPPKYC